MSVVQTERNCKGCEKEREKRGEKPRLLFRMPGEIMRHQLFRRKTLPLLLCAHCDGDNIEDAIREHDRRLAS